MDVRIGLSLWLLLLLAQAIIGARPSREGPVGPGVRAKRPVRALSEFLVPPPAPAHFRGPRGPPHPPPSAPAPVQLKSRGREGEPHTRNGRFVNPQATGNEGPGYLTKLMSWLNPFAGGKEPVSAKDSHGQGTSITPRQQYPPQQPGYGNENQYESPPHPANVPTSYSNLAGWMSGKSCNPCNQIPWIPVLGESRGHGNSGPYPPSSGGSSYLAPPPSQQVKPADFSQGPGHQQQYPIPNPHLYPGSIPPLFKAKPFNEVPADQSSQNLDHAAVYEQPPPNVNQQLQSFSHTVQNFNQPPSNFDQPPPTLSGPPQQFDHPPQNFNQQPPNFDLPPPTLREPPQQFDHPPQNFNHPSPNSNGLPQHFDHPPQNFNQQPKHFEHPPQNFDNPPQNFNQHPQSFDQPPQNYDQQSPPNFNHPPTFVPGSDHSSLNFNQPPPQNFDDHGPPIFDHQPPSNLDNQSPIYDDHPPQGFEQHHQSSHIVDVVNTPPTNVDDDEPSSHHDADHAESRPVYVNSVETTSVITTTLPSPRQQANHIVHFQRSPLIDLSVEPPSSSSSITTARPTSEPVTVPPSKVIDFIVSGPGIFVSNEEESRSTTRAPVVFTPTTTTTTTPRTTTTLRTTTTIRTTTTPRTTSAPSTATEAVDQRHQESLIETLVQSYEFFKKRNDTRVNATNNAGRLYHDPEDSSASREVIPPAKSDNGKKIIQIIIPYTSQYTPSPFHSTRSVSKSEVEETTIAEHIEDDVHDNVVSQESRRVSVSRLPDKKLRNDGNETVSRTANSIDVHRLQKNIDNWTIQEYSKSLASMTKKLNSTYPRWLASKSIPNEYLLPSADVDDSSEYYDFSNETESQRGTKKSEEKAKPESTTKVNVINATYPRSRKHRVRAESSERVYVVTPIPNPNSLEDLSTEKPSRSAKSKQESLSVERAYQVLPQAVNNLAVVASAPESAAPALWGIMEHEEIATGAEQPRWRSEADELPEPASTPILYAGHSKVSRAR